MAIRINIVLVSGFLLLFNLKANSNNVPFTIVHFSDSHSYLLGTGQKNALQDYTKGAIARVATYLNNTRSTDTNVMVFHSGDVFTGDFFFNRYFSYPEYFILKSLGFDAIAVGNHDFDVGPQALYYALDTGFSAGAVPLVSSNLILSGFPSLNQYIFPYITKEFDSVKAGIFGLTINDPSSNPFPVVINDSVIQIANATVTALKNQGCDVIICLSHLGFQTDVYMASVVPGINVILGGHDHFRTEQPVFIPNPSRFNTAVCHPGSHYRYAGKLKLKYENGNVTFINYVQTEINENIKENPEIKNYVNSFKAGITARYGNVFNAIAYAKRDILPVWSDSSSFRDTPLGNFATDAYKELTNTQISMTAVGLLAEGVYKGDVTGYDIFRATPYGFDSTTGLGFKIMKFNITGAELKRGLELIFALAPENVSYFPQFSGLRFDYDRNLPIGQRIIPSSMFVNDTAFSTTAVYTASGNEGILTAINRLGIQVSNITATNIPEYTCMRNLAEALDTLTYLSTGRIKEVSSSGIGNTFHAVDNFKLYENYPNPFNARTVISFWIQKPEYVNLKVYDMAGKEVAVLLNNRLGEGMHKIIFDGSGLGSGVYFYRMVSGSNSITKRMVLIK